MVYRLTEKHIEAAKVLEGALHGDIKAQNRLVEGISTSDYPVLLAPALQKILLKEYEAQPLIWTKIASRETVDDFRPQDFLTAEFDETDPDIEPSTAGETHFPGGLARVPEYGEYPRIRFTASGLSLQTKKNGVAMQISWEAIVNDRNFQLLRRIPGEFGRRAAIQEEVEVIRLLTLSSVWTSDYFLANTPLSLEGLQAAYDKISSTGYGRLASSYTLLVPNELEVEAQRILSIQEVRTETSVTNPDTSVTVTSEVSGNPVAGKIREVVPTDKYTALGGNAADWFLIPTLGSKPNPALVNVFLSGHERPEVFVKRTTFSDPSDGAFQNDDYESKVRHVVQGGTLDMRGALKVDGTPT